MKNSEIKKAIWAVSPQAADKEVQLSTFRALARMVAADGTIEPVAVLGPEEARVPTGAFKNDDKRYELEAETVLKSWVKSLGDSRVQAPRLLIQNIYSNNATLDVLLNYARKSGTEVIAAGTHNRKGLEKFVLGSFAETLVLRSEIPVLVVNPKSPERTAFKRVLFPTDFSGASQEAFAKVLPVAKSLGASLTLYFKFEYLVPETMGMMTHTPDYQQFLKKDMETRRQTAAHWVRQAAELGVLVEVVLDERPGFVVESILKAAGESNADLIAMASNSGTMASVILGSVARKVVRSSPVPVWILHPNKER